MSETLKVYHSEEQQPKEQSREDAIEFSSADGRPKKIEAGELLNNIVFNKIYDSKRKFKLVHQTSDFVLILDRAGAPYRYNAAINGEPVMVRVVEETSKNIKNRKNDLPRFTCELV